jgi:hypothetical protein
MKEARRIRDLLTIPIIGRVYLIGLGILAVLWTLQIFSTVWRAPTLERLASRIIEGYPYKVDDLLDFIPLIDDVERGTVCRPASLRSAAVIRLRLAEEAIKAADRPKLDKTVDDLVVSIQNSLRCAPADSFLWLVLYWAESTRHGFHPRYFDYLALSYKLGPYEGWVALKRSRFALAVFEQLPAAIAEQSIAEFAGLVNSNFYREAAEILIGPGWHVRDRLLQGLTTISERKRVDFEKQVYQLGYDVEVPGVTRPEARPWQH